MTVVVLRHCAIHGWQSTWTAQPRDLDNPRSPLVHHCHILTPVEECGLELGRPVEYVSLSAVLDAVREETRGYSDRPRRVVELVEKRLRRSRKAGAR